MSDLQYRPLCRKCAELHPPWLAAWARATVAVAEEDPIPCFCCRRTYGTGADRGTIMDCLIDPARRFPWLPEIAEARGHWWSGWPGAHCMKCGAGHALEQAVADGWLDPYTDKWDSDEHRLQVEQADGHCPLDLPA